MFLITDFWLDVWNMKMIKNRAEGTNGHGDIYRRKHASHSQGKKVKKKTLFFNFFCCCCPLLCMYFFIPKTISLQMVKSLLFPGMQRQYYNSTEDRAIYCYTVNHPCRGRSSRHPVRIQLGLLQRTFDGICWLASIYELEVCCTFYLMQVLAILVAKILARMDSPWISGFCPCNSFISSFMTMPIKCQSYLLTNCLTLYSVYVVFDLEEIANKCIIQQSWLA